MSLLLLACSPVTLDGPSTQDSGPPPVAGPCGGLTIDESEIWTQEDELLFVQASCASGVSPDATALPEGATLDAGELRWRPGPSQAGDWSIVFTGAREDGPPETLSLLIHVADGWSESDNEPVDPLSYQQEYGLPVMHVDPSGELSDEYVDAEVVFQGRVYADAGIKKRGAASLGYPKNSFTLDFDPEDQLELSSFGMGDKRHLVLITTFDDNSYVRQELAFGLWAAITEHFAQDRMVVRTFPLVVYLDGEYLGLYTAADHVDDEFMGQMGLEREGDLFKAVNHDANFFSHRSGGSAKSTLHDGYELKEGESWDTLDAVVAFTSSASSQEIVDEGEALFDVDEFMDWLIFVYFSASEDSAGKNCYLAHDGPSGLIRYAPWDFNHSWGQDWRTLRVGSDNDNDFYNYNRVFQAFQDVAGARLQERWNSLVDGGPLSAGALQERLDELYGAVHHSAARDWDRWGYEYRNYGGWSGLRSDWTSYEEERVYLEQWVTERTAWASLVEF